MDKYFLKIFAPKLIEHLPLQNEISMSRIRDYRLSAIGRGLRGLAYKY